jgi:hypothetical protein
MALGLGTRDPARAHRSTWIGRCGKTLSRSAFVLGCMAMAPHFAKADPSEIHHAADLFQQGREAMKGGNYGGACALFEASHRVEPAPGTLLNVAVCSEKLGRLRRAAKALEDFLETSDAADERRPRAEALLADVTERTPRVSIRLPAWASSEAEVLVDGEGISPAVWKAAMHLDPGRHVLEVRVPRAPDQRRTVEVKERDRLVETFVFPHTPAPQRDRIRPPRRREELPAAFFISLGVGVGGLVTAAGSGAIVLMERKTVEEQCDPAPPGSRLKPCSPAGIEAGERGSRFETVGAVALPVGVAGVALAGYLWLSTKSAAKTKIGISVAGSHTMLSATGSF